MTPPFGRMPGPAASSKTEAASEQAKPAGLSRVEEIAASCSRAFSETSDPAAYVARESTERVLEAIRTWGESDEPGSTVAALVGSPGLGKTLMLRVTEARVNGAPSSGFEAALPTPGVHALYVPYGGLELPDFAVWVHGLLGRPRKDGAVEPTPTEAAQAMLALGRGPQDPFYLLIDDADGLPSETIHTLIEHLPVESSSLRILLALNPDSKGTRLLSKFHVLQPTEIRFRDRLSIEETKAYVAARMRCAGFAEAEIGQLDDEWIHQVHSLSAGIPRALHALAARSFDDRIRGVVSDLERKQQREDWMGRPIEDELEI